MCRLFRRLIFRPSVNADAGTLSKHHVNIHVNGLNVGKMLPAEGINGIVFKAFLEHLAVIRKEIRLTTPNLFLYLIKLTFLIHFPFRVSVTTTSHSPLYFFKLHVKRIKRSQWHLNLLSRLCYFVEPLSQGTTFFCENNIEDLLFLKFNLKFN